MIRVSMLLLILLFPAAGCDHTPPAPPNTVRMTIGQQTYILEIAADAYQRQLGLMYRQSMPPDRGMIFLFPDEQPRAFWMKNTYIPLDILFLDSAGRIVSVGFMEPETGRAQSNAPAKYVIELNAGQVQAAGVATGDTIDIPPSIRQTRPAP